MSIDTIKLPPHNLSTEKAFLSCLLYDNDLIGLTDITPNHFYDKEHREIYIASLGLFKSKMKVDSISLSSHGIDENTILDLSTSLTSLSGFRTYEQLLQELCIYRQTINSVEKLRSQCYDMSGVDVIQTAIAKMTGIGIELDSDGLPLFECIEQYMDEKDVVLKSIAKYGYELIDSHTNGLRQGQLIVLGAGPGVGKSLIALNFIDKYMQQGVKSCIFSLEMTKVEIVERFFALRSGQSVSSIDAKKAIKKVPDYMSKDNLFIFDKTFNLGKILATIRKLFIQDGVSIFVIDYLQLISIPGSTINKNDKIGIITRELKVLAMELNIAIIILSQLNREGQKSEPTMSSLRDSGNIEQDANVIMLVHNDYDEIYMNIAKNRNGKTGKLKLIIDYPTMRLKEVKATDI